jgi:hypothetical protein
MAKRWRVLLSLLAISMLAPSVCAESRMIFPRILFQQGRFTGVAISNPTASNAEITITAYNPDGTLYAGTAVTNPATATIAAGSQWAKVATEFLFTSPPSSIVDSPTPTTIWLEITSPVDGLTGFFLDGSQSFDILDGSDLSGSGGDLVLPAIRNTGDATTDISIVNTDGGGSANATVELLGGNGTVVRTHSITLAARNALQGAVDSLFPGAYDAVRTMRIRSTRPLAAAAFIARRGENSLVVLGARRGDLPSRTLYFPQLVQGDGWSTTVGIANLISSPILVTLTAYKADGTLFAPPAL